MGSSPEGSPVPLASTVIGQGPPTLILHGLFGSGVNWRSIARRLETRLECHLVDQRNHGRSPHARGMAYPALAADVLGYLDARRIDRAGLIGHSMGGKTAMTLALLAPERVRWLIVADIAPASSPSDHRPILDALKALPIDTLASRTGADAALARAVSESRVAAVPASEPRLRRHRSALAHRSRCDRGRAAGAHRLPIGNERRL